MALEIIAENCVGCGKCLKACPYDALEIVENLAVVKDACTLCGACVESCPFDAIVLRKAHGKVEGFEDYSGVWVFAEQKKGKVQSVSYELLGAGRRLADLRKSKLEAVLIGDGIESEAAELIARGADKVHVVESPDLRNFIDEAYSRILTRLIREAKPEIVLCGATTIGRALIPRVAVELRTGLTADCTGLDIEEETGLLLQTRPAFGGNIMATIKCPDYRPQMATIRHKVMKEAFPHEGRTGEVVRVELEDGETAGRTAVEDVVEEIEETVSLTEADIIVSGGRGLRGPENFHLIYDLAKALNGAVGASRASVDAGWIPYSHQIGQTGKTVQPKMYIACGISGAIQHLVGMQASDIIIAINKDPEAPILNVATYGLVGDLFQVLPALTARLKKK